MGGLSLEGKITAKSGISFLALPGAQVLIHAYMGIGLFSEMGLEF